jgi:predicted ArsR family transcriptional regulator
MPTDGPDPVAGIAALVEPARRALYEYVVGEPAPVGREQAAEAVGIALHSAKFHLDRLVDEGLLEVEYRRLTGRSGPGSGRPAKLYRRSTVELSVSLPQRRYDLAGDVLATAIERSSAGDVPVATTAREVALEAGRAAGSRLPRRRSETERALRALGDLGYEPRAVDDGIMLVNCPFHALARAHTELVCGVNRAFVAGVLDGLSCDGLQAELHPRPEQCCVLVRRGAVG